MKLMEVIMSVKKKLVIFISLVVIVLSKFVPPFGGLDQRGCTALISTLGIILLLIFDALPLGLIAFIMIAIQPVLGLTESLTETASLFASPIFFFAIVGFGISAVMSKLPLTKRILRFFIRRFGKSTKGMIMAIAITAALFSTVIANFPVMLLFLALALGFVNAFEDENEKKATGKTLFLFLPIAICLGGIITPVGNVPMILCSGFLADAGHPVNFLQWMVMGGGIALVMIPVTALLVFKMFPPAKLTEEKKQKYLESLDIPEKFTRQEIYAAVILGVTILCWILSSSVPALDMMLVGVIALCFLLFPGFGIITWKEFNEKCNWSTVMLVGSILAMCNMLSNTGVIQWMVDFFLEILPQNINITLLILGLAVFTFIVDLIMTNSPALFSLFGMPVIGVAAALSVHPAMTAYPLAIFATFPVLLPLEAVYLVAYTQGYYTVKEMFRVGIVSSVLLAVMTAVWVPFSAGLMGI